jgi:hypothetical protein
MMCRQLQRELRPNMLCCKSKIEAKKSKNRVRTTASFSFQYVFDGHGQKLKNELLASLFEL